MNFAPAIKILSEEEFTNQFVRKAIEFHKIEGTPTWAETEALLDAVEENLTNATSTKDITYGMLYLVKDTSRLQNATVGTRVALTPSPGGTAPVWAQRVSEREYRNAYNDWIKDTAYYENETNMAAACKTFLLSKLPEESLLRLKHRRTGYKHVLLETMYNHICTRYQPTETNRDDLKEIREPWDINDGIEKMMYSKTELLQKQAEISVPP